MFKIEYNKENQTVYIEGNFDTSRAEEAKQVLNYINESIVVDLEKLDFICSAGIGILIMTYRNLKGKEKSIKLTNLKSHIRNLFEVSQLHTVFEIE